jgi:hypothetical protein
MTVYICYFLFLPWITSFDWPLTLHHIIVIDLWQDFKVDRWWGCRGDASCMLSLCLHVYMPWNRKKNLWQIAVLQYLLRLIWFHMFNVIWALIFCYWIHTIYSWVMWGLFFESLIINYFIFSVWFYKKKHWRIDNQNLEHM